MHLNSLAFKALAIVAVVIGLLWTGHHFGAQGVKADWEKERRAQAEATGATNRAMLRGFETAAESSRKEKERAKIETDRLRADLRSGAERLSVPVRSCEQSNGTGTGDQQARAELMPETAGRVGDVGVESDDAVRDLNACIDKYNAVKAAIERGDYHGR
jgi:hypothetical protein